MTNRDVAENFTGRSAFYEHDLQVIDTKMFNRFHMRDSGNDVDQDVLSMGSDLVKFYQGGAAEYGRSQGHDYGMLLGSISPEIRSAVKQRNIHDLRQMLVEFCYQAIQHKFMDGRSQIVEHGIRLYFSGFRDFIAWHNRRKERSAACQPAGDSA